jgi:hypothetical protein
LQSGDPTPRDAHHPDGAIAPVLGGDPLDHLDRILLLSREVLNEHHALGVAVAAHVRTDAAIAIGREPRVIVMVAQRDPIAFAIRNELQNRRN